MIIYDLECGAGHPFEGWFRDAAEVEEQRADGRLSCPACGSVEVRLLPSGGHVARSKSSDAAPPAGGVTLLQAMSRFLEQNFDNVGNGFAEEALKMHLGEVKTRNIRGTASPDEEERLREEGVEFLKVALPRFQG